MLKKMLATALVLVVLAAMALYFRAHSIFSSDLVRRGVASQLSRALGQPVDIESIDATILPRVTMRLEGVRIGSPARVVLTRLDVGASPRALLSRRIEQATITITGGRIALPLPAFTLDADADADDDGAGGVTIGSIDAVTFNNIEVVSGGRSLQGDATVMPNVGGMRIASMHLVAEDTRVDVTGEITSYTGPIGSLVLTAETLDMLALQDFAADFAAGASALDATASAGEASAAPTQTTTPMSLELAISASRATFGALAMQDVTGRAILDDTTLMINPLSFRVFEGRQEGALTLGLDATSPFELHARLAGVSVSALTAFAGQPGAMTGRLAGTIDVRGAGTTGDAVVRTAAGTSRLDVTDGTVQGLSMVQALIVASSMRTSADAAPSARGDTEAFSGLGATFVVGRGLAHTSDLQFDSPSLSLSADGHVGLDGTNIELQGDVRLSETLSAQAGRDLVRYTQHDGRVTVPIRVTGSVGDLRVRVQAADALKRAVTNRAIEEAGKALRRGLDGLFNRGDP